MDRDHLLPQHIAQVIKAFAYVGYRNRQILGEFSEALCDTSDVKSMVSALISLQKLEMPYHRLQHTFLGSLQGNTANLSFADLRFVLIALGRLNIRNLSLLTEIYQNIARSAREQESNGYAIDSREFLIFPFIVGKLQFYHDGVLDLTFQKIGGLVRARIPCAPMDAALCYEGWLRMNGEAEEFTRACTKTSTYARFVFSRCDTARLLETGAGFATVGIQQEDVWNLWADEIETRLPKLKSVSQLHALIDLFESLGRSTQKVRQAIVELERAGKSSETNDNAFSDTDNAPSGRYASMRAHTHEKRTPSFSNEFDRKNERKVEFEQPVDNLVVDGGEFINDNRTRINRIKGIDYGQGAGDVGALSGEVRSFFKRVQGDSGLAKLRKMSKKDKVVDESDTFSSR